MKNRGARFILGFFVLATSLSLEGQDTTTTPQETRGTQAPVSAEINQEKPGGATPKKSDRPEEPNKGNGGAELERLSTGPVPRLKPPKPVGPDTLDLLPTDPESVVRNKLLPLAPENPEILDPLGGAANLKGAAENLGARIKKERNRTEEASGEMALRVRFRQAYTRALGDGEVQQHWQESKQAKTDYERRESLKKYYARLYGLMRKADKNLAARVDREEKESVRRLIQRRLEPTVPPTGTPQPSVEPPADPGL